MVTYALKAIIQLILDLPFSLQDLHPGLFCCSIVFISMNDDLIKKVLKDFLLEKEYKKPRKYSKSYCDSTPCKKMGFTQKASCRPYKNCYK